MQTALGAVPCGVGGTAHHAKRWGQKPASPGGSRSLSPPPHCFSPFSQTLWFDLHQRLSDSESTACTVRVPGHHPWGAGVSLQCGIGTGVVGGWGVIVLFGSHVPLCFGGPGSTSSWCGTR